MFFKKKLLKKIKNKFKKMRQKNYIELQREKSKFARILNHEIKTALLSQSQGLELILKGSFGNLQANQKEILNEIYVSNCFLLEIINNAIFLSKFENNKNTIKYESVDVFRQLENCLKSVELSANNKKQNIILKTDKNKDYSLTADKKFVQKIIYNLLSSSVASGFEKSDIEIYLKESEHFLSFCTKNKSVYMTKEKINNMFEDKDKPTDFNQLGMSLNLNIAKKLINAHNWNLIASSSKENSAVFGFIVKK